MSLVTCPCALMNPSRTSSTKRSRPVDTRRQPIWDTAASAFEQLVRVEFGSPAHVDDARGSDPITGGRGLPRGQTGTAGNARANDHARDHHHGKGHGKNHGPRPCAFLLARWQRPAHVFVQRTREELHGDKSFRVA